MGAPGIEVVEATEPSEGGFIGRSLPRKEDPRLITGGATYIDDMALPGMLYAAIVRSTEAHARIVSVDTSAAAEREGVVAVFTGEDMEDVAPCPMVWAPPGVEVLVPEHWALARGKVGYVGQAIAIVLGEDKYGVVDAAEDVLVDLEPLPVVVDPEDALKDDVVIHEEFGTNKVFEWSTEGGDVEAAFRDSDVVVERRIVNHRISGAPIEPRGVLAQWREGRLTMWSSTQIPHVARIVLCVQLGLTEEKIRVVAPEVGGGFGAKLQVYGEEILACWCARKLGRPVKWTATRSDDMAVMHHGRDQINYVRIGAMRDGTLTAIHNKVIQDLGSYHLLEGPVIPVLGAPVLSGPYNFSAVRMDITGAFTNKVTTDAIRGAGRPEVTHLLEVCMDQVAAELGMDRLELRRKNFITEFPAPRPHGWTYDSGDYHGSLDRLLEMVDLDGFKREQEELRQKGVYRGIGFSTWVECAGFGPSRLLGPDGIGLQGSYFESAQVRVHATGSVTVYTGTSPHGQGLETGYAQLVADRLGVSPDVIDVLHGDTDTGPVGKDTYGSRSMAVGGEVIARAAQKVQDKAKQIVAHNLEAAPEDIELRDGRFQVQGVPSKGMDLGEVATHAYTTLRLPDGMEPGLDETSFYNPENFVWPFGAHACVVDVDPETGKAEVIRYVAVDDCGPAVNPMLIDGQVHGGVAQGIGQALLEQVVYDENGQLVTGTFVDYVIPSAAELPSFETDRTVTPSPVNTLGVKGIGEAGTIAASPAVVNAVLDALRPLGVEFINMPLGQMKIWRAIQAAKDGGRA